VLFAAYNLIFGFAGRAAALATERYGRRTLFGAIGVLPVVACFAMAPVLSALGAVFAVVFVLRLLPLVLRETRLGPAAASRA
jgi:hypothetical protein